MTIATHYSLQNLTPASQLHPDLAGYYVTPESAKSLRALLDRTKSTERCAIGYVNWGCWFGHSHAEAEARMVRLFKQMDSILNPHRLLSSPSTPPATMVIDPRVRDLVKAFLPQASEDNRYGVSEIDAAAERFTKMAEESGLALIAFTSPCHTNDPLALTCTWSTFPAQVDTEVWLKPGAEIHSKLTGTYFTRRAAAGLDVLLKRGESSTAQALLAELVLKIDQAFNPYLVLGQRVVIDGSVSALEHIISQSPPPNPRRITADYAKYTADRFQLNWAPYFQSAYQMICTATPFTTDPILGTRSRITCGYLTTAADVD